MNYYLLAMLSTLCLSASAFSATTPKPNHIVLVIEENRGFNQIMSQPNNSPYIQALIKEGQLFTHAYGVTHPSQPNYLALFSGSTNDITSNTCGYQFSSENLASALLDKGMSFASYSESLPEIGSLICSSEFYQRKHNPITNWQGGRLPATINLRFSDFPQDFSKLPTIAFVIPDQSNDMHDGDIPTADQWLSTHIKPYVDWAFKNNSLLILTWDEDNGSEDNHIVTLFVGPMIKKGINSQPINHYSVLRSILETLGLPLFGESSKSPAILGLWQQP
jgi:acid phosphatase